jgi:uncharacterized membrane protein
MGRDNFSSGSDGGSLLKSAEFHTSGDNDTDIPVIPNQAQKIADDISTAYGSVSFLIYQIVAMAIWVIWNWLPIFLHFDPYPFAFLSTVLTGETTLLGIFILISSNRTVDRDRSMIDETRLSTFRSEASLEQLNAIVEGLIRIIRNQSKLQPKDPVNDPVVIDDAIEKLQGNILREGKHEDD